MRIDRLTVKNFKGFEEMTFDFPRSIDAPDNGNGSFHLIIGQNGKGKTSALDALAVAAGSWFLGVRGEDSRHIQVEDIRVKVLQYGDTARVEQQLPVTVEADGRGDGTADELGNGSCLPKRPTGSTPRTSKLRRNRRWN